MQNIKYILPTLPYDYNALEPYISEEIMSLHHKKHHQAYVDGANKEIDQLEIARQENMDINIKAVMRDLSFNLNGHLLHEIFWNNMRPYTEENVMEDMLANLLLENFGSVENFKKEFIEAGKAVEASGWVTLLKDETNNLLVMQIQNHNLLGVNGFKPVLVCDVWEHAYYLDYKNDRGKYLENWWNVVNWSDVSNRISTTQQE